MYQKNQVLGRNNISSNNFQMCNFKLSARKDNLLQIVQLFGRSLVSFIVHHFTPCSCEDDLLHIVEQ